MTYEKRESRKNYENLQLDESHHPHIIPCARAFRPAYLNETVKYVELENIFSRHGLDLKSCSSIY